MKLLFITRAYPPAVGGMQKFASDFYENYRRIGEIDLLANGGTRISTIPFLLKAFVLLLLKARDYDIIHFYDAVLSPLVFVVRVLSQAKVSFTVNGLDIVYPRFGYQRWMPFFLRRADRVFPISQHTLEQCRARRIPADKLEMIPIGITATDLRPCSDSARNAVLSRLPAALQGKRALLTVGRLVKRKGHAWFISEVLPKLPVEYIYLVAGTGPELDTLRKLVRKLQMSHRVYFLGSVSEEEKSCLYEFATLFIMPNIHVEGDQEGFGIVNLEAGIHGLPVIASRVEGIPETVIEGVSGHLIREKDAEGFAAAIREPDIDRSSIGECVALHFGWQRIVETYHRGFMSMITSTSRRGLHD